MSENGPALHPGESLGSYRILSSLGSGGMGEVYRALDTKLDREVAIKVILGGLTADPVKTSRFEREAKTLAAMDHPNILAIHDYGKEAGVSYLVIELLEGDTLRERLQRGPLDLRTALRIGCQVAEGLAAAHDRGIVHRDLKPANIFIIRDGRVKILDFGLVRLEAQAHDGNLGLSEAPTAEGPTNPGMVVGTAGYMSPEQVRGQAVDPRSDVFALGIILYEMLAGRRPFHCASNADTLAAILTQDPPSLSASGRQIPPALEQVVGRCLEKDPSGRFQSARDVALAPEDLVSGDSGTFVRQRVRRPLLVKALAGGALVVVLGGALAVWLGTRGRNGRIPAFDPKQITSRPGSEGEPCLSPDGQSVAFTVPSGAGSDIQVADVRGGAPIHVTTDGASNASPAWFPDGGALAFVSSRDQHPGVWKVSRFGGSPTFVVDNAASPAISPDGQRIAFARSEGGSYNRIWVARLDDPARAVKITGDGDGVWNHTHPAWSPDGRLICYNDQDRLWVVPATGGSALRITTDDAQAANPVWSPDGRHVYFDSLREAAMAIWRVSPGGGPTQRVTFGTGSERWPSLSADGKRLAYATTVRETCCILLDRATHERSTASGGTFAAEPVFSPDGNWLAYTLWWDKATNIWRVRLREGRPEGEPERLTDQQGRCSCLAYSPDGRWIAYHRVFEGRRHVWIVPAGGGPPVSITMGTSREDTPEWSPDGQEISFASDRGGREQIWAAPFRDGQRLGEPRIVGGGKGALGMHCWSPDGRMLAFIMDDGSGSDVWTSHATGSREPIRLTRGADAGWLTVDPSTGELLVIGTWGSTRSETRRVSFSGGAPRPVPEIANRANGPDLREIEVSPEGRLMVLIEKQNGGDIWMLQARGGHF